MTTCCAPGRHFCVRAHKPLQRVPLLRRAIQLDPNYAAAYAALAETYYGALPMGWADVTGRLPESRGGNGEQGARLNDSEDVGRTSSSVAFISSITSTRRGQGRADRAIAINPNDADGLAGRAIS